MLMRNRTSSLTARQSRYVGRVLWSVVSCGPHVFKCLLFVVTKSDELGSITLSNRARSGVERSS